MLFKFTGIQCPKGNWFSVIKHEMWRGKRDTTRNISCSISVSSTFHVKSRKFGLLFGQWTRSQQSYLLKNVHSVQFTHPHSHVFLSSSQSIIWLCGVVFATRPCGERICERMWDWPGCLVLIHEAMWGEDMWEDVGLTWLLIHEAGRMENGD